MNARGTGSVLILSILLALSGCSDAPAAERRAEAVTENVASDPLAADLQKITLTVPDMACPLCAASVRAQLEAMGTRSVAVDLKTKLVSGRFDAKRLTPEAIRDRVERSGFRVTELRVE